VSSHITPQNAGVSRTLDANRTPSDLFRTETVAGFLSIGSTRYFLMFLSQRKEAC